MSEQNPTKVQARLVIDFGNSETRVAVLVNGKSGPVTILPNAFAAIGDDYVIPDQYVAEEINGKPNELRSIILRAPQGLAAGEPTHLYAAGPLADREFGMSSTRPNSAIATKAQSETTLWSFHYALYIGRELVAKLLRKKPDTLEITWDVTLLAPPSETGKGDVFKKIFTLTKSVEVVAPERISIPIKVGDVSVISEGLAGFSATVFTPAGGTVADYADCVEEPIIVLDFGAGTSDVMFIKKLSPITSASASYPKGGNAIASLVTKFVQQEYGRALSREAAAEAVLTGTIRSGAKRKDVTAQINAARNEVADDIANGIKGTFEANRFAPDEFAYLLVIGGGAVQVGGTESLAESVVRKIRAFAPDIELLPVKDGTNLRTLNIEGAINFARFAEKNAKK
ncbi:MAG: ParM/StbA family protein [Schaalia sp.]|nr:ParM/StbA family protein [Schaalia sp.]